MVTDQGSLVRSVTSVNDSPMPSFADLGLPDALERAVAELGFQIPTAIQAQAVPPLLAGRDLVGVAQTGTGKTAAFGLPLLAAVDPDLGAVQAIVLTPTRELAMQVADAIESFASKVAHLAVVAVYGGAPFLPQQRALARGAQVVVGTPGRVLDHLDRHTLRLDKVRFLVLDEADEMLRMGFAEDVDRVLDAAPTVRQVALFSATMPPAIRRVAEAHLHDPVQLAVTPQASTVSTVRQTFAVVPFRHKTGALARVLAVTDADAAIVFVRTREAAEQVGSALVEKGLSAAYISGDVAQSERERIVERLRSGALDVVVATDVAARGLDVERLGLVVNFDLPRESEAYVHRIGRTGRAGRDGEALTFVTPSEQSRLRAIERMTHTKIIEVSIPTPARVSAHRVGKLLGRVEARAATGRLELYREAVATYLDTHPQTDAAELLAVVAALAVDDEGPAPRTAEGDDLDDALSRARLMPERPEREPKARHAPHGSAEDAPRYRVSVGHRDGVQPGSLVGALTGEGGLVGKDVGKIDIFASFSLVDIPGGLSPEAVERLSRTRVAGRPLHIRVDTGPRSGRGPAREHLTSHRPPRAR